MAAFAAKNITNMTVIEFGYQLTYNVKARDPVGSKNWFQFDDNGVKYRN